MPFTSNLFSCLVVLGSLLCAACGGGGGSEPQATSPATAPVITTRPFDATVTIGQRATFHVVASGTDPLVYQWYRNGTAIPGEVSATYTTPATTEADNGANYRVTVSNDVGSVESTEATLTVVASVAASHWVSGYYVAYQSDQLPPENIDWTGLTHIMMGRIKANADGTLNESFDIGAPAGPALARRISALAHQNGVKAILMLGGDDNGTEIRAAVRDHRTAFIANLKQCMQDYGYDGIDLDWENEVDWDLFKTFAQELRAAIGSQLLTMPGGVINPNYQSVDPKVVAITPYLDQFNLMSYYPATVGAGSGWWSWHTCALKGQKGNTPVTIQDSFQRYAAAGVPKAKLGMGIGFYAIGYTGGITAPDQPTDSGVSIAGGDNAYPLRDLFGPRGAYDEAHRRWDASAECSYLSLTAPDPFGARYVSFEDESSILAKGQFVRDNGYGGIIIWTINQGYVGTHGHPTFLMQALRKGFIDPGAPQVVGISIAPPIQTMARSQARTFKALVTGTTNKAVAWSITEGSAGGSIDAQGRYTAPSTPGTYHIVATSAANPSKKAEATITVANDISWNPGLTLHDCASWWKEVRVGDPLTQSVVFVVDGVQTQMAPRGTNNFNCLVDCWGTRKFRLYAYSSDGRTARTPELTFGTLAQPFTCPIEGPVE